jgi:hypothetical protein
MATDGFAGSVEAAIFTAGAAVLLNNAYRRAGVWRPLRWLLAAVWIANPMNALYGVQGMSEAMFDFFVIATGLRFLRWTADRTPAHLAWCGVLAGLGCLVREEMIPIALIIGAGVVVYSLRRGFRPRAMETNVLLYALPVALAVGGWLVTTGVITGDPLYAVHSAYGTSSLSAASSNAFGTDAVTGGTWHGSLLFVGENILRLFPIVIALVALLITRTLMVADRLPGFTLLLLAVPVFVLDVLLLHRHDVGPVLRYQIYVIPYSFLVGAYLLADARRAARRTVPVLAVAMVIGFAASGAASLDALSNPAVAREEYPAIQALRSGQAVPETGFGGSLIAAGARTARRVAELDSDHGAVLTDSFRAFPVILNAPDPTIYLSTSDEQFEAAAAAPRIYHVAYILVPRPVGDDALDRINHLYPSLWDNGAGIATMVADLGTADHWRLYRVDSAAGG